MGKRRKSFPEVIYPKRAEEGGGRREEGRKKGGREREGLRDVWIRTADGEEQEGLLNHKENEQPSYQSPNCATEQGSLGRRQQGVPVASTLHSSGDRLVMCVPHQKSTWPRDWSV